MSIKQETDVVASEHQSLSSIMQATFVQEMTVWRESYKRMLHGFEDDIARFNKEYTALQQNWKKAMQNYMVKCKAADKAHQEYTSAPTPEKKLKVFNKAYCCCCCFVVASLDMMLLVRADALVTYFYIHCCLIYASVRAVAACV